jgi:hypothetical protein
MDPAREERFRKVENLFSVECPDLAADLNKTTADPAIEAAAIR